MSEWTPGDGWRETQDFQEFAAASDSLRLDERGAGPRFWVREEPVPALPTEPYTVIRVTNRDEETSAEFVLRQDATGKAFWQFLTWGTGQTPEDLTSLITGFEVLAEPVEKWLDGFISKQDLAQNNERVRRETAKAVLDRLFEQVQADGKVQGLSLTAAMREFGVRS